ncbi:YwqI/YxiC family protein [Bacillus aquiflavi]|uniref:YwqI/YxiC family protein n=1 Tax=Bacillus aquiflavi TaxID=2672567 RepID=A0A6B3VUE3_9BACI|nr:YwqI/YxiC family protein [Bacillus aquiflavi]MBA4535559.1 YwqI/YxiC family protein [Bacillus aquiflavi]NEY79935.1 YwqI/YxiC family protein [Bacillus aquiflavi]UAC48879.1 YwqI/YxiC family protein [Bacillus aquiflavi]
MGTIKLNYEAVIKQLNHIKTALNASSIKEAPTGSLGQNKLEFTQEWIKLENSIQTAFSQYKQIVHKNVDDTRANVDLLKKQDEAVIKS